MSSLRNILKELRIQNQKSQMQVAEALGISRSTISMYECGEREPDLATLQKIADYYKVDMNYLLGKSSVSSLNTEKSSFQETPPFEALHRRPGFFGKRAGAAAGRVCGLLYGGFVLSADAGAGAGAKPSGHSGRCCLCSGSLWAVCAGFRDFAPGRAAPQKGAEP